MVQREWVEKDFYKVLGVSSDAGDDEIKRVAKRLLAENHPDRNPNNPAAEERYKEVGEARDVLTDKAKRAEYDETRRLFASGGFGRRFGGGGGGGGTYTGYDGGGGFNLNDLFGQAGQDGGANIGDLFGGLFGRGAQPRTSRPRRGKDLETETQLDFLEATKGVAMPLRLTSPAPCTNCHGSGARPGTSPKVCASCNGSGVVNRNQGAFGFSEPCTDCRGSGSMIEHPCDECRGTGVTTRSRTINVRIPPGVEDGQRIRLAGQGEAGLRGAPSGDLYVTVHVRPDKVFGRDGDDLTVAVPRREGRGEGAQGHRRRPDSAGSRSWCAQAQRRGGRSAGHREGGGASPVGRRGSGGTGGLRGCREGRWFRPAGRLGG